VFDDGIDYSTFGQLLAPAAPTQLPCDSKQHSSFPPLHPPFVAIMKSSLLLSLYSASLAAAIALPKDPQVVLQNPQVTIEEPDAYLIELSPGDTRWVTEEEKWALRRVCVICTGG
jgi:hypothetical protein